MRPRRLVDSTKPRKISCGADNPLTVLEAGAYAMQMILHDRNDDDECVRILRNQDAG